MKSFAGGGTSSSPVSVSFDFAFTIIIYTRDSTTMEDPYMKSLAGSCMSGLPTNSYKTFYYGYTSSMTCYAKKSSDGKTVTTYSFPAGYLIALT